MKTNPNAHKVTEQQEHRTMRPWGKDGRPPVSRLTITILFLGIVLLGTRLAHATGEVPGAINYQGKLCNNLGQAVASDYYQVDFKIWSHQTRTNSSDYIWGRNFAVHVVSNGIFNVMLDDSGGKVGTPQKTNLVEAFEDPNRWLSLTITKVGGTTVSPAVEITPRQQLVCAPYAIHSYSSKTTIYASEATNAGYAVNAGNATTLGNLTTNDYLKLKQGSQTLTGDFYVEGKLGIGMTTNAMGHLDIQAGADADGSDDPQGISLGWRSGGYRHWIRTRHNGAGAVAGNSIDFYLNTGKAAGDSKYPGMSNVLTLTLDNGKVGIGTSSPDRPLTIKPNGTEWISLLGTNATTKWHINNLANGMNFAETGVSGGDGRLFLQPSGNVGIGTTSPAGKLDVQGSIKVKGATPIVIRRYSFSAAQASQGPNYYSPTDGTYSASTWSAAIIGFTCSGDFEETNPGDYLLDISMQKDTSGNWQIQFDVRHDSLSNIKVDVMYIRKELTDDNR